MNTAIAAMMTMVNEFSSNGCTRGDIRYLLLLLSPFAPHIVEELWEMKGFAKETGTMACQQPWPVYDESKTVDSTVEMAIQVNGKLRGTMQAPVDLDNDTIIAMAHDTDTVKRNLEKLGGRIVKTIVVKNKLVNVIIK